MVEELKMIVRLRVAQRLDYLLGNSYPAYGRPFWLLEGTGLFTGPMILSEDYVTSGNFRKWLEMEKVYTPIQDTRLEPVI